MTTGVESSGRLFSGLRAYGWMLVLVFLSALSTTMPLVIWGIFIKRELEMPDVAVSVFFFGVLGADLCVSLYTGHRSDSAATGWRLLRFGFGWVAVGYLLMSFVDSFAAMFAVGIVFLSLHGTVTAQMFAIARAAITADESLGMLSWLRMAGAAGWISGALLGGLTLGYLSMRSVMLAAAAGQAFCFAVAAVVGARRRGGAISKSVPAGVRGGFLREREGLLIGFLLIMVLLASGKVMQTSFLPVILSEDLGVSDQKLGIVLGIPPLLEIALIPVMVIVAKRIGRGKTMLTGVVAVAIYYGGVATVFSLWEMCALQVIFTFYGAASLMVCIDIAQRLVPERPALSTTYFFVHEKAGVLAGSLVSLVSVYLMGPKSGFAVPFVLSAVGLALLTSLMRRHREQFDLR